MKGITAVIALILLIFITISIVAIAYLFFFDILGKSSAAVDEAAQNTARNLNLFTIEGFSGSTIYIRNKDPDILNSSVLAFYADGNPVPTLGPTVLIPQYSVAFIDLDYNILNSLPLNSESILIVSSGIYSDSIEFPYSSSTLCTDADSDGFNVNGGSCGPVDCDDGDNTIWQYFTGYGDDDNDGFTGQVSQQVCTGATLPPGYSSLPGTDCDDNNNTIWLLMTGYIDNDQDTFSSNITSQVCTNGNLPPWYESLPDNDCNDNNNTVWRILTGYRDNDGDTYSVNTASQVCSGVSLPQGYDSLPENDCNDNNPAINPGATDVCGDGIDQDCSGADLACAAFTGLDKCNMSETCTAVIYYRDTRTVTQTERIRDITRINTVDLVVLSKNAYEGSKNEIASLLEYNVTVLYYDSFAERTGFPDDSCCPKSDWNTINQNENWFLHNNTQERWTHPIIGYYWMNTSNPDYRNHVSLLIENVTKFDPKFDGVFIDESVGNYSAWTDYGLGIPWARPPPPPYTQAQYEQGVIDTAQRVKQQAGTKIVFTNGATPLFMPYVDGGMIETFALRTGSPTTIYYTESGSPFVDWVDQIDNLNDPSLDNRISIAHVAYFDLTETEQQQVFNFSYTTFLLGKNPNSYTFFVYAGIYSAAGPFGNLSLYYPEYDIDTGATLGDYYKTASNVYVREFQNIRVGVNPGNNVRNWNFPGETYWMMNGSVITNSITLANHTGVILFRNPVP